MSLAIFNPRFPSLFRDFDEFFKDFTVPRTFETESGARAMVPPVDIVDLEKAVELRIDLPGLAPDDIDVRVDGNMLTVTAERKNELAEVKTGVVRQERAFGKFTRSFNLPSTLDGAKPDAAYRHGVLTLTLPKKEEVQPKSLKIRVEA